MRIIGFCSRFEVALLCAVGVTCASGLFGSSACSVQTRSGEFRCVNQSDCDGSRVCSEGWCVRPGNQATDGGIQRDASSVCPPPCDSCSAGVCEILCASFMDCREPIKCPSGLECEVTCEGSSSCDVDIDCRDATACTVECEGSGSCSAPILCSAEGPCDVDCDGLASCRGGITSGSGPMTVDCRGQGSCGGLNDCSEACSCDIDCTEVGSCETPAMCPRPQCSDGDGCEDSSNACNTC